MAFRRMWWLRNTFALTVLAGFAARGNAGNEVSANPTRPSVTDNAYLTVAGYLEVETGGVIRENAWSIPTLVKLGMSESIELGGTMTGLLDYTQAGGTDIGAPGFQVKGQLFSGEWGALSAAGRIDWPQHTGPNYTVYPVISLRALPVSVDATAAVVYSKGATEYIGQFQYAVALSPRLDGDIGLYVEVFGLESSESSATGVDAGISYAFWSTLVFDAAFNTKVSGAAEQWGVQFGLTWNLGRVF